jgi:WD40 repeat protein
VIAATKFECFCVDPAEAWLFAGNASGQISAIDIESFEIAHQVQAHAGVVQAIACHRREPYVAALSTDRHVSVWRYDPDGALHAHCKVNLRAVRPDNDAEDVEFIHSTSQAIGFHDHDLKIVTRSANAGLLELAFDDGGGVDVLRCVRLHGHADLITARYAHDSDAVLSGAIDGELVLSRDGRALRRWNIGLANVHWAEHVADGTYLLASDARCVARIQLDDEQDIVVGRQFTRDDLEHVTYNQASGRAFVGSFDRTIYELDPQTCAPTRAAFEAPFKCRWVKTLERSPSTGLVQCRNGALYKVDVDSGETLATLRSTPPALWTSVVDGDGALVLHGDGERIVRLAPRAVDPVSRTIVFDKSVITRPSIGDGSYSKRAVRQAATAITWLARTSGAVVALDGDGARVVARMDAAVRDIDVDPSGPFVFVVCEDASAHKLDANTGERLLSFASEHGQPLWSLSYNPQRRLLAVGERGGEMFLLSADDFRVRYRGLDTARAKRIRWVDGDLLLYNHMDEIRLLDLASGRRRTLVQGVGNTIEDFIWDAAREYLLFISYTQNLYLADFRTGEIINWVPDQVDYSKGLAWMPSPADGAYPLDFVTYGRSGTAHAFRVHDEKILALGPL